LSKSVFLVMASLNVSMPEELRKFVDKRTKQGRFSTPSEYVRELIREDQKREAERRLEQLLLEGLESGDARGDVKALFRKLHKRVDELEVAQKRKNEKTARPKARR